MHNGGAAVDIREGCLMFALGEQMKRSSKSQDRPQSQRRVTPSIAWLLSLLALTSVAGVLTRRQVTLSVHNKACSLSATDLDFVRPGLVVKIESASIDAGGVISAKFKLTDPKGLP